MHSLNPFDCPDGVIILEPRSVYDKGLIRYDSEQGCLIYDFDKCVEAIMEADGCSCEEATEWLCYNTVDKQMEGWPLFESADGLCDV